MHCTLLVVHRSVGMSVSTSHISSIARYLPSMIARKIRYAHSVNVNRFCRQITLVRHRKFFSNLLMLNFIMDVFLNNKICPIS